MSSTKVLALTISEMNLVISSLYVDTAVHFKNGRTGFCILHQHGCTMSGSQGVGLVDVPAQSLRSYGPHPTPAHDNQGHTGKGREGRESNTCSQSF